MAGGQSFDGDGPIAAINVTPLVDVMLVLLIIFMVTAPMLQAGVEVDLPKATNAPLKTSTEQIVLSIDKDGKLFLGSGNELGLDDLAAKVRAVFDARPDEDKKIFIKGDNGLNYGVIMQVMARLHEGGITQIGLVSAPPSVDRATNEKAPAGRK